MSESAADKLMRARCRLMTREPWYGHMAMSIEWKPSEMGWVEDPARRTIGMRITNQGIIQAVFNPEWVEATDLRILYGTVEHCINHLIRLHTLRQDTREPEAWNLASDMSVNGESSNPYVGYREEDGTLILPDKGMVFVPKGWPNDETAEHYYERILKESPPGGPGKGKKPGGGQGQGQGQGKGKGEGEGDEDGEGEESGESGQKPGYYKHGKFEGKALDDHDSWRQSEISQDEARQLIHDMVKDASEKSQGNVPGHLKQVLDALSKPIIRWREFLRQYLGTHVGSRRKTYSRADRRTQAFGQKGISRHAAATVQVICDTSGSIGTQELEQFFAEVEAISYRAKVFLLQWDAEYQGYGRYRRGEWKKLTINGRGGTDMAAPFDWLDKNTAAADVVVLLTDGYCNWPFKRPYPTLFVITTDEQTTKGPDWGTTLRMKIHE